MGNFNRFGNMFPPDEVMKRSYLLAEEPFRIYGNLYFVGNTWCSSHLIDTGEGLILLDTCCLNDIAYLINNIWKLGFQLSDLKWIVVSHAHPDHYGAVRGLVHLTGAKTFISKIDGEEFRLSRSRLEKMNYNHGPDRCPDELFEPDVLLEDGEVIQLGNTRMRCVVTPGHTIGTMSHFWEAYDKTERKKVGIYGGAGFRPLGKDRMKSDGTPESYRQVFEQSIDKVWKEEVDINLGNHPFHNDTFEKHERRKEKGGNPFIDPTEWQRFLQALKDAYHAFIKLEENEIQAMLAQSEFLDYRDMARPYLDEKNR